MRRVLLSAFVVFTFTIYAIHYRFEDNDEVRLISQKNASSIPTIIPTAPVKNNEPTPTIIAQEPTLAPTIKPLGQYRDGEYLGDITDAYYGNVQVKVVVSGGRIADVLFLDYPRDRQNSQKINTQATPILRSEAIAAQNSSVDMVTGATETSGAFIKSLESALVKARV